MSWSKLIKVEENLDEVKIAGQTVKRPSYITPGEWVEFWERVKRRGIGAY